MPAVSRILARGGSAIGSEPVAAAASLSDLLANLRTIPNVTILQAGEGWHLSTGDATFTPADLAAAVAALDDPAIHAPILKLGHTDPRPGFDGQPAFGKLINLRVENEGMDLVADIAGVPQWMADAMPTSWPTRSIEGYVNYQTATGKTHPLVITGLALLAEGPAIETLEDLPLALGTLIAAETAPPPAGQRFAGRPSNEPVMASVTYEDVRRAFYDALNDINELSQWAWIRELVIDPPQLVVDDDDNGLYRVTYAVAGNEVTFGEPEQVRVEYVAASVAPRRDGVTVFASREQSVQPAQGDVPMDLTGLRQSLGLPDSTPNDEVLRLATERLSPPVATATAENPAPTEQPDPPAQNPAEAVPPAATPVQSPPPPAPAPAQVPPTPAPNDAPASAPNTTVVVAEDTPSVPNDLSSLDALVAAGRVVVVDAQQWAQTQNGLQAGQAAAARLIREDRERFMQAAIAAGKVGPQNTELIKDIEDTWNHDPAKAARLVASLQQAFPVSEIGHAAGGIEAGRAAEVAKWDEQDNALWGQMAPSAGQGGA